MIAILIENMILLSILLLYKEDIHCCDGKSKTSQKWEGYFQNNWSKQNWKPHIYDFEIPLTMQIYHV